MRSPQTGKNYPKGNVDMDKYDHRNRDGSNLRSENAGNLPNSDSIAKAAEPEPEPEVNLDVAPVDEEAIIEERRRRREAILAKYKGVNTPSGPATSAPTTPTTAPVPTTPGPAVVTVHGTPRTPQPTADEADIFDFSNAATLTKQPTTGDEDGPSAVDYDAMADKKSEERHHAPAAVQAVKAGAYDETKVEQQDQVLVVPKDSKEKEEFDMFADEDDMFADPASRPVADASTKAVPVQAAARQLHESMLDTWDDTEGYYRIIPGELLENRYVVQSSAGKGMFSGVAKATDTQTNQTVAVKFIRNNESMRKAGMKEIGILKKLNDADPEGRKHIIKLERWFEHKGHLCMVFEGMSMNLRDVLKKFGRDIGINLRAVRAYAHQMFLALSLLRKAKILHADIKPDNMLVNDARNILKICDLGSACEATENDVTPYLVSRFYRAPEIILGVEYGFGIDVWSIGCSLYEMYTGKILFPGRSNNQMLKVMMELKGRFPKAVLKKGEFTPQHFDEQFVFLSQEKDKLTGKDTVKPIAFVKPTKDLKTRLMVPGMKDEEKKLVMVFVDLLEKCLELNPERRITAVDALRHPFITGKY
ncbi:U4/U6 small nuclear ribonucleoprotein prp4 [Saitoella coloradoensis]